MTRATPEPEHPAQRTSREPLRICAVRHQPSAATPGKKPGPERHRYRIGGLDLVIDQSLPLLTAFALPCAEPVYPATRESSNESANWQYRTQVQARGLVAGAQRLVSVNSRTSGLEIQIEGFGTFPLRPGVEIGYPDGVSSQQLAELLCGPLLPLALAARGTYCLHGAACSVPGGGSLTLILGDSGAGKSTLSQHLAAAGLDLWADDTVAVHVPPGPLSPVSPGAYPQPKWPGWRSRQSGGPSAIRHVICLSPTTDQQPVELRPLTAQQGVLMLVRHTVAGRLLPPPWLAQHLRAMTHLASHCGVFELGYPRALSALPDMVSRVKGLAAP